MFTFFIFLILSFFCFSSSQFDESEYPEKYRKVSDYVKGSNIDSPSPFQIGEVTHAFFQNLAPKSLPIFITFSDTY